MATHQQQGHANGQPCQIMTVLGPIKATDGQFGPVMMHEKVVSSSNRAAQTESVNGVGNQQQQPPLKLEHLSSIRRNPFKHSENMNLASENEAIEELQHLSSTVQQTNESLAILDMTTATEGRDPKALQRISRRLKIHILVGTTCLRKCNEKDASIADSDTRSEGIEQLQQNIEHMERELKFGIGTTSEDDYKNLTSSKNNAIVRSSFCGPVSISKEMTKSEQKELQAYAAVHGASKAPLIICPSSLGNVSKLLDFIESSGGLLTKTIVAHADVLVHEFAKERTQEIALSTLQEQVLRRGVTMCFDRFSLSSCSCFDFDETYPTIATTVDLVSALLHSNNEFVNQIIFGSGLFMKLQYRKYGGIGYPIVMEELVPRLAKRGGLTQDQIDIMLKENPRRLLQWWTPPPLPEIPKSYLTCSICNRKFEPILGEYFTKYTFIYCGTKCLRKHSKAGFKPLPSK